MNKVYRKRLTDTESNRHLFCVLADYRDWFPLIDEPFYIVIDGERIEVVVGSLNRIWAVAFWKEIPSFKTENEVVFNKKQRWFL